MSKTTSFLYLIVISSLALGLMSCNNKLQTNPELAPQANVDENLIPADEPTGEQADITPDTVLSAEEPQYETAPPKEPTITQIPVTPVPKAEPTPTKKTDEAAKPVAKKTEAPKKAEPTPPLVKKEEPKKTQAAPMQSVTASNIIIAAYNTMVNEGKKIGPACNFYVGRVLEVLGFKKVGFLANDFDVAAKKLFSNYKVFTFTNATELKRHLWSYRDRSGFILQWERVGAPGHIAIVERVGESLYIYQASLNKYTARVDKTTLERLLLVNNNKGVRVYSDFQK